MSELPRISHHGVLRFGALEVECAVLNGGERGFLLRQFAKVLGYRQATKQGGQFARFLRKFAPKYMSGKENAGLLIINPGHGLAQFIPADAVVEAIDNVIGAALDRETHWKQKGVVAACREMQKALGVVGLVALIDEATGAQYQRAPDALRDLINRLILQRVSSWKCRFKPSYYKALAKVTGTVYRPHAVGKPTIWGLVTRKWVYEVCFPPEVLEELDRRPDGGEKLHQWLADDGIQMLEKQIKDVELLAACSANFRHFEALCSQAFNRKGQIGFVYPEAA